MREQGANEQLIEAPPARIWAVLEDPALLPQWVPAVERMTAHGEREAPGAVRRCDVNFGGRKGYIVERCVEAVPERRLLYAVDDDSLGFTKLFAGYHFSLELEPRGERRTLVTSRTFYEPRGMRGRLMNRLMSRKFASVRAEMLLGLKRLADAGSG
jgi:uncharacterized protein YndB with AHSA1/START domain